MILGILGDIRGCVSGLQAVLRRLRGVDTLISLGDVGRQSREAEECRRILQQAGAIRLKGEDDPDEDLPLTFAGPDLLCAHSNPQRPARPLAIAGRYDADFQMRYFQQSIFVCGHPARLRVFAKCRGRLSRLLPVPRSGVLRLHPTRRYLVSLGSVCPADGFHHWVEVDTGLRLVRFRTMLARGT